MKTKKGNMKKKRKYKLAKPLEPFDWVKIDSDGYLVKGEMDDAIHLGMVTHIKT